MTTEDASQTQTTSGPLLVNADEVGDIAERLEGLYLFPVHGKVPKCPWQSNAATGREAVETLWRLFGGFNEDGTPARCGIGVACDPSGIFVVDEDRDWRSDELSPDTDWREWDAALNSHDTLILPSSNRGRPHYYFRQPSDGNGKVAERVWLGGEVKSKGFVVLAAASPIHQPSSAGGGEWTPADIAEAIPPLANLIGRRRDGDGNTEEYLSGRVTKEEFADWINQEPGEHFGGRLVSEDYEDSFLGRLVDRLHTNVESGTSRRIATRDAVHTAIIESYQGFYSLQSAYDTLLDAYEELRTYGPGDCSGDKGWTKQRQDDFHAMWETEINKPDALRSAEESYDEVLERLSSSGSSMEMSEEDMEEDLYCMEVIFAASDPEHEDDPVEEDDTEELNWDDIDVDDPAPEPPGPPPAPPTTKPDVETKSPITLGEDAKQGPLWDLASGLIGQHELPHEALMITLAAWAGAVLGSAGAGYMPINDDRHGPELCVCMVGTSAVAHKSGTIGFGHMVFSEFWDAMETAVSAPGAGSGFFREVSGIESGQAFIEVWPTASDIAGGEGIGRAVIMVEPEISTMWKRSARKGSTIPEEIRKAWDGAMLTVRGIRAGNHRVMPQNYRFSAVGATIHSLAAKSIVESDAAITGDGNRWLWCWGQEVDKPVKGVPSFQDHPLVLNLRNQVSGVVNSIEEARQDGWWPGCSPATDRRPRIIEFGEPKLGWSPEADQLWLGDDGTEREGVGIYADLRDEIKGDSAYSPVVRGMMGRNAQQVMRLAIGYEMLRSGENWAHLVRSTRLTDNVSYCISAEALKWALAVWRYCADTLELLFSDTSGDDKIDELVLAIGELGRDLGPKFKGYVLKSDVVGTGFSKNQIAALIAQAENQGAIWTGTLRKEGRGGRPIVLGLPKWNPPPEVDKR